MGALRSRTSPLPYPSALPTVCPQCGGQIMTLVYRYYDQSELERQLNARATVPDITPILAQYSSESESTRSRLPCRLAVPYGASEPERLDIFPAATGEPSPIFVFIHGGYWRLLDSADSCFMAEHLTQAGACVVAVNYALAPFVTLAEITRQCRAAVAWVHGHAREFGGDPSRIHVCGSSAGGHLAAMMLVPGWEADFGVPSNLVVGATLLSGLYDLEPVRLGHHLAREDLRRSRLIGKPIECGCFRSSSRPTMPSPARRAAPAWVLPYRSASLRCTAAEFGSSRNLAKARLLHSRCRSLLSGRWSQHEQTHTGDGGRER